jgi:hypothetical protein
LSFAPSTRFESWVTNLRLSWMSVIGRRIWGGFASVLGDRSVDWAVQGNLEHMPEYASDQGVALIADERQIDRGPSETVADLAKRETQAYKLWRFAGTPLGLLLGLHYAEFDDALIVTQNGLGFQLTLPLPDIGPDWDPTPNLVKFDLSTLICDLHSDVDLSRSIPVDTPWWTFDSDTDHSSRFAVLFPGPLPSAFDIFGAISDENLARLRAVIMKWKPAKALCDGVYVLVDGKYFGWPLRTFGSGGLFGPSTVVPYSVP